jgi:hypothetical protein
MLHKLDKNTSGHKSTSKSKSRRPAAAKSAPLSVPDVLRLREEAEESESDIIIEQVNSDSEQEDDSLDEAEAEDNDDGSDDDDEGSDEDALPVAELVPVIPQKQKKKDLTKQPNFFIYIHVCQNFTI